MCNISPGDKCRDGRDGDAGSGWFSKSHLYLHYYWKRVCRSKETKKKLGFRVCSLMVLYYPQIIQTKGSYSFLLCGMIIACIGFILFIGLLLFHRMHRNYLAGTLSDSTLIHCCWTFSYYYSFFYPTTHPPSNSICIPTGTTKKSAMVEEQTAEQNGSAHTEQKEESTSSWGQQHLTFVLLLASVGYEQYVNHDLRHLTISCQMNTVQIFFGSVFILYCIWVWML